MSDRERTEGARVLRSPSGWVSLGFMAIVAVLIIGDAVVRGGWTSAALLAPWPLLVLWATYVISFASSVRLDDAGVVVQNLLRRTSFGWKQITDIDMTWQLEFTLADGKSLTCLGGPLRSRPPRPRRGEAPEPPRGVRDTNDIIGRWERAEADAAAPIRRGWDTRALIVLGVLAVWAGIAVLVANA